MNLSAFDQSGGDGRGRLARGSPRSFEHLCLLWNLNGGDYEAPGNNLVRASFVVPVLIPRTNETWNDRESKHWNCKMRNLHVSADVACDLDVEGGVQRFCTNAETGARYIITNDCRVLRSDDSSFQVICIRYLRLFWCR